jgi:hypothetical protein
MILLILHYLALVVLIRQSRLFVHSKCFSPAVLGLFKFAELSLLILDHLLSDKSFQLDNKHNNICYESRENWLGTCKAVEWGLLHSCNTYVAQSGRLTLEGKRACDCISGGGLLTGAGLLANISPVGIIQILQPLSKLYGCDGIVNWNQLNTASNALSFLKILNIG